MATSVARPRWSDSRRAGPVSRSRGGGSRAASSAAAEPLELARARCSYHLPRGGHAPTFSVVHSLVTMPSLSRLILKTFFVLLFSDVTSNSVAVFFVTFGTLIEW